MNVFTATGNLGRDMEVRQTSSGTDVGSFSVGVKAGWGDRASTLWVNCTLWGKQATSLEQYLKKGQPIAFTGELSTSEYETNDGIKRFNVDCNVKDITLLKSASPMGDNPQPNPELGGSETPTQDFDDDAPF